MEQGPPLALGDMSPQESTVIDDVIMSALNCKIRGDLQGALRGFREVLSHQFDSNFDVGRRVTAKLNIASVLNMLQRHQTALGQAVDALVDLQQQCPLLRSIIGQRTEQFYNRHDVQQILSDLAKIPECLHVLVPAAWLQCAVALQAMGKKNLSELSLKRCDELEKFMLAKSDTVQIDEPPSIDSCTSHSILLPQQPAQAPSTRPAGRPSTRPARRPQTAKERQVGRTPAAQSKSRSRSRRPNSSRTRSYSQAGLWGVGVEAGAASRGTTATESATPYHMAPRRPATARRQSRATRDSACRPQSARQSTELSSHSYTGRGAQLHRILDPRAAFDELVDSLGPLAQMHPEGACSIPQAAPTELSLGQLGLGQFQAPPAAPLDKPPPLRDIFAPPPAAASTPSRPRSHKANTRKKKLQSNAAQAMLFGTTAVDSADEEKQCVGSSTPNSTSRAVSRADTKQECAMGEKEKAALEIQKIARGRAGKNKSRRKKVQQEALKQIQGAIRGNSARLETQSAVAAAISPPAPPSPASGGDVDATTKLEMIERVVDAFDDALEPAEADETVAPEQEYVPLPGRKEMTSLREEIFNFESKLPAFMHETTQAEQRYAGKHPERVDLKTTARAVIKQLERLDKKNLFKLKSVTNAWLEGGNVAGIRSI